MKKLFFNKWIVIAGRGIIGGIFIYAGTIKFRQPLDFADSVASFQLLPVALINICALMLPCFEVVIGSMLVTGWKPRIASLASFMLTVLFAVALGQALIRGLEVDCGCFGSAKPSMAKTWASLGRDILLLTGSLWLYLVYALQKKCAA